MYAQLDCVARLILDMTPNRDCSLKRLKFFFSAAAAGGVVQRGGL